MWSRIFYGVSQPIRLYITGRVKGEAVNLLNQLHRRGYVQLKCPLCGRNVPVERFDPSGFDDDLIGIQIAGCGKGRGFKVTGEFSLLHDAALTGVIIDRCKRIVKFCRGVERDSDEVQSLREENKKWADWGTPPRRPSLKKDRRIEELLKVNDGWVKWGDSAKKSLAGVHEKDAEINRLRAEKSGLNRGCEHPPRGA